MAGARVPQGRPGTPPGSLFVALLSGACFVTPDFANDALPWPTIAIPHTLAISFLLVGIRVVLNCRALRGDLFPLAGGFIGRSPWYCSPPQAQIVLLVNPKDTVPLDRPAGDVLPATESDVDRTELIQTLLRRDRPRHTAPRESAPRPVRATRFPLTEQG
jgi:hypothetical protein